MQSLPLARVWARTRFFSPAAVLSGWPQPTASCAGSPSGAAGIRLPAGPVPVVAGAVVYDLALGSESARPTADAGYAACDGATATPDRGSVGVGTGCSVGKLLGEGRTKGGFGLASVELNTGGVVAAVAAVNAVGEVLDVDGAIIAGTWREGDT